MDTLCNATPICPITHLELVRGSKGDARPSIDRIIPALGYVPSNVRCISYAANRAKGALHLDQVERLLAYLKGQF